jgi:hypothetical protein
VRAMRGGETVACSPPERPSVYALCIVCTWIAVTGCQATIGRSSMRRHARVDLLQRKSDAAATIRIAIEWCETQTDLRVQRVRHYGLGGGGGPPPNMGASLLAFYRESGIQQEPTAGYSPESKRIAEGHNLTLLDMALPMFADSRDERSGLPRLDERYAGHAIFYVNNLLHATPASGVMVGRTPEAFFAREVAWGVFRRVGCHVWIHQREKPLVCHGKRGPRGWPGRFLGCEHPFGSGMYHVLLDIGEVTQC